RPAPPPWQRFERLWHLFQQGGQTWCCFGSRQSRRSPHPEGVRPWVRPSARFPEKRSCVSKFASHFILDVNANNLIKGCFGGEAKSLRAFCFKTRSPASDHAHNHFVRFASDEADGFFP